MWESGYEDKARTPGQDGPVRGVEQWTACKYGGQTYTTADNKALGHFVLNDFMTGLAARVRLCAPSIRCAAPSLLSPATTAARPDVLISTDCVESDNDH